MWSPSPGSCSTEDNIHPFYTHFLSAPCAGMGQDESNPGPALWEHAVEKGSQDKYINTYCAKQAQDIREWGNSGQGTGITKKFKVAGTKAKGEVILEPEPEGSSITPLIK